ncbi:cytochrome oxidase assembly protein [Raineyella fluvialis]|uniref:Cytochrome oxidase assembly protein n=1 Tax=Raineyella fluvialis TaxID=2662261 RepID=A0A5Q2F9Y2_9ACTN|nr:cytochrome oxidase assembly protein [Raineyella fluvialis]QGF23712.1 cytochrome oxidase assembly protein [Raineyella fluvialis]
MTASSTPASSTITLYRVAAVLTFAAVALGSLVCATDSSAACPNWPGCYVGQVMPRAALNPVIEFVHRVIAVSTGPALLAAALLGLRRRRDLVVSVLPWLALAGALAAGIFGMLTIRVGLTTAQGATDLGASLIAMIAMTTAAVALSHSPRRASLTPAAAYAWAAVGVLWLVHVTGVFAAGKGSLTRCVSCPVWGIVGIDGPAWLQVVRMVLAAVAIAFIVAAIVAGRRVPAVRSLTLVAAVLLVVELAVGLVILARGTNHTLSSVYAVSMVCLLWTTVLIAARSTFTRVSGDDRPESDVPVEVSAPAA